MAARHHPVRGLFLLCLICSPTPAVQGFSALLNFLPRGSETGTSAEIPFSISVSVCRPDEHPPIVFYLTIFKGINYSL